MIREPRKGATLTETLVVLGLIGLLLIVFVFPLVSSVMRAVKDLE